jgi:hypothetical protein
MKTIDYCILGLTIIVLILMINPFSRAIDTTTNKLCYEDTCIKSNLDLFGECVDVGYENCGFFCSNHYWLCDGIKIKERCLEYGKVLTNKSYITYGMDCIFENESKEKESIGR